MLENKNPALGRTSEPGFEQQTYPHHNKAPLKSKRVRVRFSELSRAYEFEKQAWIARHPDATHTEYESAMRRIADELGF